MTIVLYLCIMKEMKFYQDEINKIDDFYVIANANIMGFVKNDMKQFVDDTPLIELIKQYINKFNLFSNKKPNVYPIGKYKIEDFDNLESLSTIQIDRNTTRDTYILDNKFHIMVDFISPHSFLSNSYEKISLLYEFKNCDKNIALAKEYNANFITSDTYYGDVTRGSYEFKLWNDLLGFLNHGIKKCTPI